LYDFESGSKGDFTWLSALPKLMFTSPELKRKLLKTRFSPILRRQNSIVS